MGFLIFVAVTWLTIYLLLWLLQIILETCATPGGIWIVAIALGALATVTGAAFGNGSVVAITVCLIILFGYGCSLVVNGVKGYRKTLRLKRKQEELAHYRYAFFHGRTLSESMSKELTSQPSIKGNSL